MKIGWTEIVVIIVVALIVLGPEKFPEYAKKAGKALRSAKLMSEDISKEIRKDIVEPLNEAATPINELKDSIENPLKGVAKDINNIGKPIKTDVTTGSKVKRKPSSKKIRTKSADKKTTVSKATNKTSKHVTKKVNEEK